MITARFRDGGKELTAPVINPGLCDGNAVVLRHAHYLGSHAYFVCEVEKGECPVEKLSETSEGTFLLVPESHLAHWSCDHDRYEVNSKGEAYFPHLVSVLATPVMYHLPGHGLIDPRWLESPEVYQGEGYTVNAHK